MKCSFLMMSTIALALVGINSFAQTVGSGDIQSGSNDVINANNGSGSIGGVGGTGGSGGAGGAGGSGGAGGTATGGSSSVGNVSTGASTSRATGGRATVGNLSTGASTASTGAVTNHNKSSSNTSNAGNSNNSYTSNTARPPASTAFAAPLVASEDTCMGSSSLGGQGLSFGVSVGSTWTDENCKRLKNSRRLQELGYKLAAIRLVCKDKDVADVMSYEENNPCAQYTNDAAFEHNTSTVILGYDNSPYEKTDNAHRADINTFAVGTKASGIKTGQQW